MRINKVKGQSFSNLLLFLAFFLLYAYISARCDRNVLNYNKMTYVFKTVINFSSDGFFRTFFFLNITTEHKQYSDYI